MDGLNKLECLFIEQMLMLSCSFGCDRNSLKYDFDLTLLWYLGLTYMANILATGTSLLNKILCLVTALDVTKLTNVRYIFSHTLCAT